MAYTRLLRAYYRTEKPIPCDQAYRLARANSRAQRAAVDSVLREFFKQDGDCWRNKRADEEIIAYQAQADTNRRIANNRKGIRTVNESSHEPTNESSTKRTPNQIPDTKNQNQEPETSKSKPLAPSDESLAASSPVNGKRKNGVHKQFTDGPTVIAIPLIGEAEYEVHQSLVDELDRCYPAVDGLPTLREIRAWNIANPRERKTEAGILRHINRWFAKEQNKG